MIPNVLVIYTGGTIGSIPRDPEDENSPLVPARSVDHLIPYLPIRPDSLTLSLSSRKVIQLGFTGFQEPVDSSNITTEHWVGIAKIIQKEYKNYDGFVILHGTDTMAYSASALSFMFHSLSKPVVFTGSQKPLAQPGTDAVQNFVSSVELAAARHLHGISLPEVAIVFRDLVLRGNRTTKISANHFQAFDSPNFYALGKIGKNLSLEPSNFQNLKPGEFHVQTGLSTGVISLEIFPGMDPLLLRRIFKTRDLKAVVLLTFGAGNAPSRKEFLEPIREAVKEGLVIVDVTQCWSGEVEMGFYEASEGLLSAGVVSGLDMTPEAALTKLMVLFGQGLSSDRIRELIPKDLRGELSRSIYTVDYGKQARFQLESDQWVKIESKRVSWDDEIGFPISRLKSARLRLLDVQSRLIREEILEIRFFDSGRIYQSLIGLERKGSSVILPVPISVLKAMRKVQDLSFQIRTRKKCTLKVSAIQLSLLVD